MISSFFNRNATRLSHFSPSLVSKNSSLFKQTNSCYINNFYGSKSYQKGRWSGFKSSSLALSTLAIVAAATITTYEFVKKDEYSFQKIFNKVQPLSILNGIQDLFTPITSFALNNFLYKQRVPYLIVGGGTAGYSAAIDILNEDPKSKILIISNEKFNPYIRTILSKDLWQDSDLDIEQIRNGTAAGVFVDSIPVLVEADELFKTDKQAFSILKNKSVVKIDTDLRQATLSDNTVVKFEKILLATGMKPELSQVFSNLDPKVLEKVMHFHTMEDFIKLYDLVVSENKNIAIMDGAFIASELTTNLTNDIYSKYNNKYTLIFPNKYLFDFMLPEPFAKFITEQMLKSKSVQIYSQTEVKQCSLVDGKMTLKLSNGNTVVCDQAIDGCRFSTYSDLGKSTNVTGTAKPNIKTLYNTNKDPIISGYSANALLQTGGHDIYTAGACSVVYDPLFNMDRHFPQHSHAVSTAYVAATNMVGKRTINYNYQPTFWTSLFNSDLTISGIGLTDSSFDTITVWTDMKSSTSLQDSSKLNVSELKSGIDKQENKAKTIVNGSLSSALTSDVIVNAKGFGAGVIFYLNQGKIVGVINWNIEDKMHVAERIISGKMDSTNPIEIAKHFFQ